MLQQQSRLRQLVMRFYAPNEKAIMGLIHRLTRALPGGRVGQALARGIAAAIERWLTHTVVMTREEVLEFIRALPDDCGIALGNCPCKEITHKECGPDGTRAGETVFSCRSPLLTDVQIGSSSGFYLDDVPSFRPIGKQELLEHEERLLDLGLVPNVYLVCRGEAAICNCSPQSCIPFIANREVGGYRLKNIHPGRYVARQLRERCTGCEECLSLAVCPFEARRMFGESAGKRSDIVSRERCFGCGKCAEHCSRGAIEMVAREEVRP